MEKKQPFDLLFLDAFCVVGGAFPTSNPYKKTWA